MARVISRRQRAITVIFFGIAVKRLTTCSSEIKQTIHVSKNVNTRLYSACTYMSKEGPSIRDFDRRIWPHLRQNQPHADISVFGETVQIDPVKSVAF